MTPAGHRTTKAMRSPGNRIATIVFAFASFALGACATAGSTPSGSGASPSTSSTPVSSPASVRPAMTLWPVKTAEHVDLWLHSFAMISNDSAPVPLYRRGYRDSIAAVRSAANTLSSLDGNRVTLASRLAATPSYLQAQFLPFDFGSWEEMRLAAERFLQFEGEPRRAPDQQTAARVAQYAAIFPTAGDREWLRLFIASVQDEHVRWFESEHARQTKARAPIVAAIDSLWSDTYRAKFDRFLNNTSQRSGDILLSLPVGGEGRTGVGRDRQTVAAVTWPGRVDDAREAILVFVHEITGSLVSGVVSDNTSPAEKRDGLGDRYVAFGQVRAGAMLLEKVAPELLEPYMRYYLAQAGARADGGAAAAFARTFTLPKAITDGLLRQMEIVLGGI